MNAIRRRRHLFWILIVIIISTNVGFIYGASSTNYILVSDLLSAGGGSGHSINYNHQNTIGQASATGESLSGDYINHSGFWNIVPALRFSSPVPGITANGSDISITITTDEVLSISVEIYAGDSSGNNVDWWMIADTPFGWYCYEASTSTWKPGQTVTYKGALFDLGPYEVLNMSGLPSGHYIFYFGVDMIMNGSINMGQIYYDSLEVVILP